MSPPQTDALYPYDVIRIDDEQVKLHHCVRAVIFHFIGSGLVATHKLQKCFLEFVVFCILVISFFIKINVHPCRLLI